MKSPWILFILLTSSVLELLLVRHQRHLAFPLNSTAARADGCDPLPYEFKSMTEHDESQSKRIRHHAELLLWCGPIN